MKVISSKSVNFSKSLNFNGPGVDDETYRKNLAAYEQDMKEVEEAQARAKAEATQRDLAKYQAQNAKIDEITGGTEPEPKAPGFDDQFAKEQELKVLREKAAAAERNKAQEAMAADTTHANKVLGVTPTELANKDMNIGTNAERPINALDEAEHRGQFGDVADSIVTAGAKAGQGLTSALGSVFNKFGATNVGANLKNRANAMNPELTGLEAGNWADKNKVAAGAIGAGALLGAGALAYKAKKLMDGKKELKANAYYAFGDGNISSATLIGGPYATRADARNAKPEAAHILKGSTLGAYGDFEIAA